MKSNKIYGTALAVLFACFSSPASLFALNWVDGGEFAITSGLATSEVTTCFNSSTNQVFAVWGGPTELPNYATFQNGTWTNGVNFSTKHIHRNIYCCNFNAFSQVVATWADSDNVDDLASAYFQSGSWTNVADLASPITADAYPFQFGNGGQVVATWRSIGAPTYATFNGTMWSAASGFGSGGADGNIYSCYDTFQGVLVATWQDGTSKPHYAIYNGTIWTTDAEFLPLVGTSSDIFPCYNSASQQIVATWVDSNGFPHSATFDGISTWTDGGTFATTSGTPQSNIICCYDSVNNLVVATWADGNTLPHYATLQNGVWTDGGTFATSNGGVNGGNSSVFPVYNSAIGQVVATWQDSVGYPHYAYTISTTSSSPLRLFTRPVYRIR